MRLIIKCEVDINHFLAMQIHIHSLVPNTHAHTQRSTNRPRKTRNRTDVLLLRSTASHTLNIAQQPTLPPTCTPVQRRRSTLEPESSGCPQP
jgi:hypothetical protein